MDKAKLNTPKSMKSDVGMCFGQIGIWSAWWEDTGANRDPCFLGSVSNGKELFHFEK